VASRETIDCMEFVTSDRLVIVRYSAVFSGLFSSSSSCVTARFLVWSVPLQPATALRNLISADPVRFSCSYDSFPTFYNPLQVCSYGLLVSNTTQFEESLTFRRNTSPPSSGSKNKIKQESSTNKIQLLMRLVSFSTLNILWDFPPKRRVVSKLQSVGTQKTS
jgi:hypothetical protein